MPWIRRKTISQAVAMLPSGTRPQNSEAPAKMRIPAMQVLRCPKMSPSLPPRATKAAVERA